jgi:hypothetical protein
MAAPLFSVSNFLSIRNHLITNLTPRTLLPVAMKCFGQAKAKATVAAYNKHRKF